MTIYSCKCGDKNAHYSSAREDQVPLLVTHTFNARNLHAESLRILLNASIFNTIFQGIDSHYMHDASATEWTLIDICAPIVLYLRNSV